MQSKEKTITDYLNSLPDDRKKIINALRKVIKQNIPAGFKEEMSYGTIGYVVPHKLYPDGYHCKPETPLPFINLASQKKFIALYHMGLYEANLLKWFKDKWKEHSSKKLDMGKTCVRFKNPDDVPLDLIGALVGKITPQDWIAFYEKTMKK